MQKEQETRRGRTPRTTSFANSHSHQAKTSAQVPPSTTTPSTTWRASSSRRPDHCCRRRRHRVKCPRVLHMPVPRLLRAGSSMEHVFCRRRATSPTAMRPPFATTIPYRITPTSIALRTPSTVPKPSTAQKRTVMALIGCVPTQPATNPIAIRNTLENVARPVPLPLSLAPTQHVVMTTSTAVCQTSVLARILPALSALKRCVTINTYIPPRPSAILALQPPAHNHMATRSRQRLLRARIPCRQAQSVLQRQILSPHQTIFSP